MEYLCRPQLQGRLTGTRGEKLATNYVALFFETLGLEPAGVDDSWFQRFDFTSGISAGDGNDLRLNDASVELNQDWRPLAFSATGEFPEADVLFQPPIFSDFVDLVRKLCEGFEKGSDSHFLARIA